MGERFYILFSFLEDLPLLFSKPQVTQISLLLNQEGNHPSQAWCCFFWLALVCQELSKRRKGLYLGRKDGSKGRKPFYSQMLPGR
jgi:hypothetical protein